MTVTTEASNRLYASGWRAEQSPLDGPRVVKDFTDQGVYATLVPDPQGVIHWAVWAWSSGNYLAGGHDPDPEAAARAATEWITEEWA